MEWEKIVLTYKNIKRDFIETHTLNATMLHTICGNTTHWWPDAVFVEVEYEVSRKHSAGKSIRFSFKNNEDDCIGCIYMTGVDNEEIVFAKDSDNSFRIYISYEKVAEHET